MRDSTRGQRGTHEAHRRRLLSEWEDIKASEYREIQKAAKKVSRKLHDRVKVEVTKAGNRDPLEQLLREVELECLPADIPKSIEADVSHLVFGVDIRVRDLAHGDKLKFLTDEDRMVAHITTVKEEVVVTPEAVADATAAPAEPEVIKKGKQEVEGEEAEAKPEGKPEKAEKAEKKEKK